VSGWANAVSINYSSVPGWAAPCVLGSGSAPDWIGLDNSGDNPCGGGAVTDVVNIYYLNTFTIPPGCSVTQANMSFEVDDFGSIWLNGVQLASSTGAFNVCTSVTVPLSAFQTGPNALALEAINQPIGPGFMNYQGLTYDFCYSMSCQSTPTVTPTSTATPTPNLTGTPTATPTSCSDQFFISKNILMPSQGPVTISVVSCNYPGGSLQASYSWDGTNKYGAPCASGVYIFYLTGPFGVKTARVALIR
jgi:hypothetical protein